MPLSLSDEIIALVAGAVTIVVAIAWRARARRRSQRLFRDALVDPDVATRRAAVLVVGEVGLSRHAPVLLRLMRREEDPGVLDALADSIARNQWEPADQPAVFELRMWAHRRIDARPTPRASRPRPELARPRAELALPRPQPLRQPHPSINGLAPDGHVAAPPAVPQPGQPRHPSVIDVAGSDAGLPVPAGGPPAGRFGPQDEPVRVRQATLVVVGMFSEACARGWKRWQSQRGGGRTTWE